MDQSIIARLHEGIVIPAHPLALNAKRELDERHQRALTRYYIDSGAGGVAVGVHTTQFEIRDPKVYLYEPVLQLAAEEIERAKLDQPFIKIAGICGPTKQALEEAQIAKKWGYHLGLVSPGGLENMTEEDLLKRTKSIAEVIPVFGFYLQPGVGGRVLSYEFWKAFCEIPNVMAIKVAPFNRYQTLEVVRAVCYSTRYKKIALYTGNDDNIVGDLLTTYRFNVNGTLLEKQFAGGLLGHWAVWTNKAVELLEKVKAIRKSGSTIPKELLTLSQEVTDTNCAFFDVKNSFAGCIAGIHEILRRQGLLEGRWCLNPKEDLGSGQMEEINRVYHEYPHLNDDVFVQDHLEKWFAL